MELRVEEGDAPDLVARVEALLHGIDRTFFRVAKRSRGASPRSRRVRR